MKNRILVLFLFFANLILSENEPKILVARKKFRCTHLYGTNLDECLKEISYNHKYKENLIALDKDQRENHVKRTLQTHDEYKKFFDRFSEDEWNNFYNDLTPEIQNLLPETKENQTAFLKKITFESPVNTQHNLFETCKVFCANNKYPLLATATLSIYCYVWWKLNRFSQAIYFKNSWSCWKDEIPLEVLYDLDTQKVRTALITIITETYEHKIDNISDSLLIFKKDIYYEMECLQNFVEYYRFLKRTWLSYLFPSYEKAYKRAQEKIDRLMYMEELIEDSIHEKYMI